ncbi:MAG TPA: hypothetical protein DEP84_25855 [Chloroflexi bacterium]|nr:hypothetical protein [Chloroflexota bacterium]
MRTLIVKANTYRDSVSLMLLAEQVRSLPGVVDVALLMGTPANYNRLVTAGYLSPHDNVPNANDLCVGIEAADQESLHTALAAIEAYLHGVIRRQPSPGTRPGRSAPRSLDTALRLVPDANLVAISVPGEYAVTETRRALEHGRHVFLFSDNVPIEAERQLKAFAVERGLLLMGPDCGTAHIAGRPLGFCNVVAPGPVGVVAASGTGAQEIMTLLGDEGIGISHVIGTGGRDLQAEVGGLMTALALEALGQDPATEVIVLVSKPPHLAVGAAVTARAERLPKPVVACFVGDHTQDQGVSRVVRASHLMHAARAAAALVRNETIPAPLDFETFAAAPPSTLAEIRQSLRPAQRFVRGLYSGGTLADESAALLARFLPEVQAGEGFGPVKPVGNWSQSAGNVLIDLGDDRFTRGRPHPMIDPRPRAERLLQEARDPTVAALILDVILGLNAHDNPASVLAPAVRAAHERAASEGRELAVLVHVCGTPRDPQRTSAQRERLETAGCIVFPTNVEAALAAGWLARESQAG